MKAVISLPLLMFCVALAAQASGAERHLPDLPDLPNPLIPSPSAAFNATPTLSTSSISSSHASSSSSSTSTSSLIEQSSVSQLQTFNEVEWRDAVQFETLRGESQHLRDQISRLYLSNFSQLRILLRQIIDIRHEMQAAAANRHELLVKLKEMRQLEQAQRRNVQEARNATLSVDVEAKERLRRLKTQESILLKQMEAIQTETQRLKQKAESWQASVKVKHVSLSEKLSRHESRHTRLQSVITSLKSQLNKTLTRLAKLEARHQESSLCSSNTTRQIDQVTQEKTRREAEWNGLRQGILTLRTQNDQLIRRLASIGTRRAKLTRIALVRSKGHARRAQSLQKLTELLTRQRTILKQRSQQTRTLLREMRIKREEGEQCGASVPDLAFALRQGRLILGALRQRAERKGKRTALLHARVSAQREELAMLERMSKETSSLLMDVRQRVAGQERDMVALKRSLENRRRWQTMEQQLRLDGATTLTESDASASLQSRDADLEARVMAYLAQSEALERRGHWIQRQFDHERAEVRPNLHRLQHGEVRLVRAKPPVKRMVPKHNTRIQGSYASHDRHPKTHHDRSAAVQRSQHEVAHHARSVDQDSPLAFHQKRPFPVDRDESTRLKHERFLPIQRTEPHPHASAHKGHSSSYMTSVSTVRIATLRSDGYAVESLRGQSPNFTVWLFTRTQPGQPKSDVATLVLPWEETPDQVPDGMQIDVLEMSPEQISLLRAAIARSLPCTVHIKGDSGGANPKPALLDPLSGHVMSGSSSWYLHPLAILPVTGGAGLKIHAKMGMVDLPLPPHSVAHVAQQLAALEAPLHIKLVPRQDAHLGSAVHVLMGGKRLHDVRVTREGRLIAKRADGRSLVLDLPKDHAGGRVDPHLLQLLSQASSS